jgi:hypothetical protein
MRATPAMVVAWTPWLCRAFDRRADSESGDAVAGSGPDDCAAGAEATDCAAVGRSLLAEDEIAAAELAGAGDGAGR